MQNVLTDAHICDTLYIRKYGCQGLSQNSLKFEKKKSPRNGREGSMKKMLNLYKTFTSKLAALVLGAGFSAPRGLQSVAMVTTAVAIAPLAIAFWIATMAAAILVIMTMVVKAIAIITSALVKRAEVEILHSLTTFHCEGGKGPPVDVIPAKRGFFSVTFCSRRSEKMGYAHPISRNTLVVSYLKWRLGLHRYGISAVVDGGRFGDGNNIPWTYRGMPRIWVSVVPQR